MTEKIRRIVRGFLCIYCARGQHGYCTACTDCRVCNG